MVWFFLSLHYGMANCPSTANQNIWDTKDGNCILDKRVGGSPDLCPELNVALLFALEWALNCKQDGNLISTSLKQFHYNSIKSPQFNSSYIKKMPVFNDNTTCKTKLPPLESSPLLNTLLSRMHITHLITGLSNTVWIKVFYIWWLCSIENTLHNHYVECMQHQYVCPSVHIVIMALKVLLKEHRGGGG